MRDQVEFLFADKCQSLLQISVIAFAESTQNKKFAISLNIVNVSLGINIIFCMKINKVFYKLVKPVQNGLAEFNFLLL